MVCVFREMQNGRTHTIPNGHFMLMVHRHVWYIMFIMFVGEGDEKSPLGFFSHKERMRKNCTGENRSGGKRPSLALCCSIRFVKTHELQETLA